MNIKVRDIAYYVHKFQQDDSLPYLILLHGFMGSSRAFDHLLESLSLVCNPVAIDLLGHGKTDGAQSADRFKASQQIKDLQALLPQITRQNPFFLHGYSMGGRLALRYALAHPDMITGLILESTHYGLSNPRDIEERGNQDERRAQQILNDYEEFLKNWWKLPLFDNGISVPVDLKYRYEDIQRVQDPEQMAFSLQGFGAAQMPSVKEQLSNISTPVQLLAGEADQKYCRIAREMDTFIPRSNLSIISVAGHRVHLENPKAFVTTLKPFLKNRNDL